MSTGRAVFRALIRLLPRAFRDEYGAELLRVADEQWSDRPAGPDALRSLRFWARQSVALVGASVRIRHRTRRSRGGMTVEGIAQDLRNAARGLLRRPGFTAVTVLTLGLGIGATTAIFSAVNTVLLRPLPYDDADRVAVVFNRSVETGERGPGVSAANIRDYREAATRLEQVAVAEPWSLDLLVDGRAHSLRTWAVSEGFFQAIGAHAMLGRTFVDADHDEGRLDIVVMSYGTWVSRFGADPSIVGRPLSLDGEALTVVGVMPPHFRFPDASDMWIPRPDQSWDEEARPSDFMTGVARLAPGASLTQARAEADRVAGTLRELHPRVNADLGLELVPLRDHLFGSVRTPLLVLMAAVAVVLLITCANVAGLMLARGAQRARDYALRGALGAGTGRLVSHVTAESAVLAFAGCGLGVALTRAGIAAIQALGPDHLPRIDELSVDRTVLAFAVGAAASSALLSGLAPSLRLSRPDLRRALGDGSRGSTGGRREARARSRLVVAQVAAAVVLLFGAGLLLRSFGALLDEELGFETADRVALQIFAYDYAPGEVKAFVDEAVVQMKALPGVTDVALTTSLPAANDGVIANLDVTVPFTVVDRDPPPGGGEPTASVTQVSPGYFRLMGIEVTKGRGFGAGDNADGAPVLVVNEALARRHFAGADPVGEALIVRFGRDPAPAEIVGVVRDTRPLGHASEPRPEVYLPLAQVGAGSLTFVLRAESDAEALTLPAMEAIWAANPGQSVWGSVTVEGLVSEWLKERRFNLFLLTTFSAIALVLSAIGLYGLVSFSVERRVGELGIRRALGGRSGNLLGMVLGEGMRLAATGLAIGLAASWYLSRFLRGMLYRVEPTDPLTFATLGVLVLAVASLATAVPALRALRVDPAEALRSE